LAFGNNRAIYKLYFTSAMKEREEAVTDNTAYKFAKMMIPVVNQTLFGSGNATPGSAPAADAAAPPAEATPAEPAAAPAA
jgi:hypothetical protein